MNILLSILIFLFSSFSAHAQDWQETESEHFVYHFHSEKTAETITTYAEIYYQWIKTFFGITEDEWPDKAKIFIYEDEAAWKEFVKQSTVAAESPNAYTNGRELFIYRTPFWLSPRQTLAHEITHIVLYRFLGGPIPLFLNEGFAEYVSYKMLATHFGGNEYAIRTVKKMTPETYIPLSELIEHKTYPKDNVKDFYKESELLVRFLIEKKSGDVFYQFLDNISKGESFEDALETTYELTLNGLEEEFNRKNT